MFLNSNEVVWVNTYNVNNPQTSLTDNRTYIINKDLNQYDFWYVQFTCKHSFSIFNINEVVPEYILDKVRTGDVFLVLDNAYEYFPNVVESIYDNVIIKHNIPPKQIIIVSGNYDLINWVKQVSQQRSLGSCKVEYFNYWEVALRHQFSSLYSTHLDTLQIKPYLKKFLCLNRFWRMHRVMLLSLLYNKGLIDKGSISFKYGDDNPKWDQLMQTMLFFQENNPEMLSALGNPSGLKNLLPLNLDNIDLDPLNDHGMMLYKEMDSYYLNTYFSLVTETIFDKATEGRFLSEKIFKPIVLCHPFIVCGAERTLEALHNLGYKTFEGIIDESYDLEPDNNKRLLMIVDEVDRLSNLTEAELNTFLEKAKAICLYNFEVFINRQQYIWSMD